MYSTCIKTFFVLTLIGSLCAPQNSALAEESFLTGTVMTTATFRFNNDNWSTVEHPRVASFSIRDDGSAYGITETNVPFEQFNVSNSAGIRIQRFEIQDHYHYIIEGEIANTFEELSAKLAQAYALQTTESTT